MTKDKTRTQANEEKWRINEERIKRKKKKFYNTVFGNFVSFDNFFPSGNFNEYLNISGWFTLFDNSLFTQIITDWVDQLCFWLFSLKDVLLIILTYDGGCIHENALARSIPVCVHSLLKFFSVYACIGIKRNVQMYFYRWICMKKVLRVNRLEFSSFFRLFNAPPPLWTAFTRKVSKRDVIGRLLCFFKAFFKSTT